MSKPNNSIRKVASGSNEWEIIPHGLTDGTNLASVPSSLGQDQSIVTSMDTLMIPASPVEDGIYLLMVSKNNGVITLGWKNTLSPVLYYDAVSQQARSVSYEENEVDIPVYYSVV